MNLTITKPGVRNPQLATRCTHCGETCADQSLIFEATAFCCSGCQLVYEILDENGLCKYYDLENTPGLSFKNAKANQDFDYLNSPEILNQLVDFQNEKIVKITLQIPSIHCTSCLFLLENFYKLNPGVEQSKVNFLKKELQLTFVKKTTSLAAIVGLLHRIGYAPEINLGSLKKEKTAVVPKSFYLKLGVTGFVFGNVMLLSFPEYLGLQQGDNFYFKIFGYLNLALGIPLVFYSGSDYLRSAWLGLRERELNMDVPISLGIFALFGRSAFEILTHTGAGYMDSLAGLMFFLLIGKWFQQTTFHNINFEKDYQSYFPIAATVIEPNGNQKTPLKNLKSGDQIFIKNQELIPADSILQSNRAEIDYSFVTGESAPVAAKKGDLIYAGGRQIGGAIKLILTKSVSQSYLIQLWNDPAFAKISTQQKIKNKALGASQLATTVSKYFTFTILAIAGATLFYWLPKDWTIAINAFSAVLIVACPCAVALSVPFTYGNVLRLLARKSFYLKSTSVIENLQNITHIVFDKTGTLTERQEQLSFTSLSAKMSFESSPELQIAVKELVSQSSHPRSQQIFDYVAAQFIGQAQNHKQTNLPNKLDGYIEIPGKGISGRVGQFQIKIGSASFFNEEKLEKGNTYLQANGEIIGFFKHESTLREGLENLIKKLKPNYQLSLLSGDHSSQSGKFNALFGDSQFFDQSPQNKLDFIKKLQSNGARVLMIGDGLNDSGALKEASVGVVISENNNNFTPAGDGILGADSFEELADLIAFAKRSRFVVYGSYFLALIYNIIGLSFAVRGVLSPVIAAILMPVSSITIVVSGLVGSWALWAYFQE